MAMIKENPTLRDLQQYQEDVCRERGWDKATHLETFLLFTEEVGELANAIRYQEKIFTAKGKTQAPDQLEKEFADVFSYLLELANHYQIDLEKAYRYKEELNSHREWNS